MEKTSSMSISFAFVAMLLMALLALPTLSFAGLSIPGYNLTKTVFNPSDPGIATISVTNPSGSGQVTSISLSLAYSPEILVTATPKMADIDAGGSTVVSIPFKIKSDAKPGIYTITATFTGYVSGTAGSSSISSNAITIPLTIVRAPQISTSVDDPLLTGVDTRVITLTNNGGVANNVRIRIPGDVSLYGTDKVYVGTVTNSTPVSLKIDSRKASDGPIDMLVYIDYDDEIGISHTDTATMRMNVRNQKLDLIFSQLSPILTKKENNLTLEVRNSGAVELKDVRLSFTDSSMRLKEGNEVKFGDIAPGETVSASFIVFADLSPGLNSINSTLGWVEKDIQKTNAIKLPLTVTSDADVGVYLEAKPTPLTIGQEHTISVLISNLGSYPIDNVEVHFASDTLRSLDISNSQYIGSLNNDDFSTVQFKVLIPEGTSEGTHQISLNITYRDKSGEWKQKQVVQDINVYSSTSKGDATIPILLGVVVVVAAVWYFFIRKKKSPVKL